MKFLNIYYHIYVEMEALEESLLIRNYQTLRAVKSTMSSYISFKNSNQEID